MSETADAMTQLRNGAELHIDHPTGEIVVTADSDDVYYSFTAEFADGSTTTVEGISIRHSLIRHEYWIE